MSSTFKYAGVYVPLDVLLDTRLGTIAKEDPDMAAGLAETNYRNRQNDDFDAITRMRFKELYAKRDKDTLKLSLVTEFVSILRETLQSMAVSGGTEKHPQMPKLYVNLHPYQLDEEEESELGIILHNLIVMEGLEIELISKPMEELTPEYCLDHFVLMAMYLDYNQWLDHHRFALHKQSCRHIVLMVPAMYDKSLPTEEQLKEAIKWVGVHPLEMLEINAKEFVDLTMIDPKYFSVQHFGHKPPTEAGGEVKPVSP